MIVNVIQQTNLTRKKINSIKYFSILHLNIHTLELHIEELRVVLKIINLKFDFICITESKLKQNTEPKIDVKIDDYQYPVGTATETTKGGALVYAKEGIDFIPREDLNIIYMYMYMYMYMYICILYRPKELESYFIETLNKKGKNTIIGTIYRHPCMDQNTFIDDYIQQD